MTGRRLPRQVDIERRNDRQQQIGVAVQPIEKCRDPHRKHSIRLSKWLCDRMRNSMRKLALHLPRPYWWTAIFSGVLAVTAVGAVGYARDPINETRQEA